MAANDEQLGQSPDMDHLRFACSQIPSCLHQDIQHHLGAKSSGELNSKTDLPLLWHFILSKLATFRCIQHQLREVQGAGDQNRPTMVRCDFYYFLDNIVHCFYLQPLIVIQGY